MNVTRLIPIFLLVAGPALWADSTATPVSTSGDLLNEALPILQAHYIDGKNLEIKTGDHLSDLMARSGGKISLVAPNAFIEREPIVTATLPDDILYWRLASFTPEKSRPDLGTQLQQAGPATVGIILDLRSNIAPDDYAGAAQVLNFFAPKDKTLSKFLICDSVASLSGIVANYSFHAPIVVLTNNQTTGAAEALAACLKADGALVIGRATAGKAAVFGEQKLSSGEVLRYVTGDVLLADGTALWQHPVVPDISLNVHDQAEKGALVLIGHHGILDVIQEDPARHRMSEAALVQGDDPEWDEYLASLKKKPFLLTLPTIHDVVLISALDSLKAIRLSQRHETTPSDAGTPQAASASIQ